ncbi:DUF1266 domain-containing protein, partial [Bacteroides heparinolyticus]
METINSLPFNANPQPGIAGSDKLHALFTGLMAGEQYGFYTNSLTTGANRQSLGKILSANNIESSIQLPPLMHFLKEEGERSAYDIMLPLYLSHCDETQREAAIRKKFIGIERLVHYCRNLDISFRHIRLHGKISITNEDLQRGILAWDLGKIIKLSRTAYDCRLISEQEAWEYIEFSDKKCREYFVSWEEVGKSYLLGQAVNYPGEKKFRNVIECYCTATRNTESPWMRTPFRRAYFS